MIDNTQLLDAFDKFKDALLSNEVKALDMLIADEYVGFDPYGAPQDKEMILDAYKPGAVKIDKYDSEDVEARVIGEVGIITGKGYIYGTFGGSEFEHSLRFLDLYVCREGKWQLYMSQITPLGPTTRSGGPAKNTGR